MLASSNGHVTQSDTQRTCILSSHQITPVGRSPCELNCQIEKTGDPVIALETSRIYWKRNQMPLTQAQAFERVLAAEARKPRAAGA